MRSTNDFLCVLCIILALNCNISLAASNVDVTLQFQDEDTTDEPTIIMTKKPIVDNFDWFSTSSGNKAVWTSEGQSQDIKDVEHLLLHPSKSISAYLSYEWSLRGASYGMSQYAFNYENRSKEYGCFVTELRLSGSFWQERNYNIVLASYRKDPNFPDDYLTCSAEKNSNNSFTVHMMSSKNKENEKNILYDNERFSKAGDVDQLSSVSSYQISRSIELWKDLSDNKALILSSNNVAPTIARPEKNTPTNDFFTIQLANFTKHPIVAGDVFLNSWATLSKDVSFSQPQRIEPGDKASDIIFYNTNSKNAAVRLNYHFDGYQESSGCYIIAMPFYSASFSAHISTYYRLDPKHPAPDNNLYCFISTSYGTTNKSLWVAFYEDINAITEIVLPEPKSVYISYFSNYDFFRQMPPYKAVYDTTGVSMQKHMPNKMFNWFYNVTAKID